MSNKHERIAVKGAILAGALSLSLTLAHPAQALTTQGIFKAYGAYAPVISVATQDIGIGAQTFIDGMAQRAIGFIGNGNMTYEQKSNEFRRLLQDSFDMETIGRFALGRYWRTATPEQRKEYQKLFREMVVKVYSDRFREYEGQNVETRSHRIDGDNDTIVTSFIVPKEGPEVQVDWRVRFKNSHYQIVDVIVEGVSMSVTQRSDFSSVIQRGGGDIKVLLDHLKQ